MRFVKGMLKNRWFWMSLVFLFGAAGSQTPRLELLALRVTSNLHRVEYGMTLADVEQILGPPKMSTVGKGIGNWFVWEDGRTEAILSFDPETDLFINLRQHQKEEENLVERIRDLFGRLFP